MTNQQVVSKSIYPPIHSITGLACVAYLLELQGKSSFSFPQFNHRELQDPSTLHKATTQMGLASEIILIPPHHLEELAELAAPIIMPMMSGEGDQVDWAILWNKRGNVFEVLDPKLGRRWLSSSQLNLSLRKESITITSQTWFRIAQSDLFLKGIARRLQSLHLLPQHVQDITASYNTPEQLRILDAAIRFVSMLANKPGGILKGEESYQMLKTLCDRYLVQPNDHIIPRSEFTLLPIPENHDWLWQGHCVLVATDSFPAQLNHTVNWQQALALLNPFPPMMRSYLKDQKAFIGIILLALLLGAVGTFFQAILLRGVMLISTQLSGFEQQVQVLMVIAVFFVVLGLLRLMSNLALMRLGHQLDGRLRMAILCLLPTLRDDVFQRIPIGDLSERTNSLRAVRHLPYYFGESVQLLAQLVLTALGLIWLDWVVALLAIVRVAISFGLISVTNVLNVPNKITRQNLGLLGQFHLDTLLSLLPIRSHVAEASTTYQHNDLLGRWLSGRWTEHRIEITIEWVATLNSFLLVALIMWVYAVRATTADYWLLVLYWSISLDVLGTQLMSIVFLSRRERSKVERFIQLINEADQSISSTPTDDVPTIDWKTKGVNIHLQDLTVHLESQTLLRSVNLHIEHGEHVAVVGLSGAGKSTLANLLLGMYSHFDGVFTINGQSVNPHLFDSLRQHTVWVSPNVKLWNRTLLENLQYGASKQFRSLDETLTKASLNSLIERLPEGMQTTLFEDGKRISGGERQKIQFGRALQREGVCLAILDEPFSELSREEHRALLKQCRTVWRDATLLYITHDIELSTLFDRVLVVNEGRIIEDGMPQDLLTRPSWYAQMLQSANLWDETKRTMGNPRRLRLQNGIMREDIP